MTAQIFVADWVAQQISSFAGGVGTGAPTLGAAKTGGPYRTLTAASAASGCMVPYAIKEGATKEETGFGIATYSGGAWTVTREIITASSNGGSAETFTTAAIWELVPISAVRPAWGPGYVAGRWYGLPQGASLAFLPLAVDTIKMTAFMVAAPITVSDLGTRSVTNASGKSLQLALYAADASTGYPTGNALGSTGSLSLTTAGSLSGAMGANVTLLPGRLYWAALNADTATPNVAGISGYLPGTFGDVAGDATLGNILTAANSQVTGLTVSQAFGTWPDLTSASFTKAAGAGPKIFAKAA